MYAPSGGWFTKIGPYDVERIDEASSLRAFLDHSIAPNKFLVHTIEGLWPQDGDFEVGRNTLNSNGFFPHFLVARDKAGVMRIGQFISTQVQGRACKAPGNTGTIQVEVGGKAASPFTGADASLTEAVRLLFQVITQLEKHMNKSRVCSCVNIYCYTLFICAATGNAWCVSSDRQYGAARLRTAIDVGRRQCAVARSRFSVERLERSRWSSTRACQ